MRRGVVGEGGVVQRESGRGRGRGRGRRGDGEADEGRQAGGGAVRAEPSGDGWLREESGARLNTREFITGCASVGRENAARPTPRAGEKQQPGTARWEEARFVPQVDELMDSRCAGWEG